MTAVETVAKLKEYKGSFSFLVDLKGRVLRGKTLSEAQLASAAKCLGNAAQPKPAPVSRVVAIDIIVKKWFARTMQRDQQLQFAPFTLTITEIHSESAKAVQATVKMTAGEVNVCRCCGASLTDEKSQATGLGPVCAKKLGVKYVTNLADVARFKVDLQKRIDEIGSFKVWIPRSQVLTGL